LRNSPDRQRPAAAGEGCHGRPTAAVVDTGALGHNFRELKKIVGPEVAVMAVVKADAYGHGDVEVSRALASMGCDCLGVAMVEEGLRLRRAGISIPVVVLGGVYPDQAREAVGLDLTPVVFDVDSARAIDAAARSAGLVRSVYVKIDTGMGRLGLLPAALNAFFEEFRKLGGLRLEGVMSHLAESEAEDKTFTLRQIELFGECVAGIRSMGIDPGVLSIANSAAAVELPASRLDLVRPGIMLYGSYPSACEAGSASLRSAVDLRPVMEVKTRVLQVKDLPAGAPVSYGRTFTAARPSRIAVLPMGYGDGLPRSLSGRGFALVRGRRAPVAGVVCMDFTMVDVTDIDGAASGDEAVIIGTQGRETLAAEEVARSAGTIAYELFCGISARVPRVYV